MAKKQPKYEEDFMLERIEEYTNNTDVPILKELCVQEYWNYDYIQTLKDRNENIEQSIKRLIMKKESALERLALNGKIDKSMAVFSLKQLGWSDKVEHKVEDTSSNAQLLRQYMENKK